MFSCVRKVQVTCIEKPKLKIIIFQNYKHWYSNNTYSDKGFKSIVVNRALPSLQKGSVKITRTVPLSIWIFEESFSYN